MVVVVVDWNQNSDRKLKPPLRIDDMTSWIQFLFFFLVCHQNTQTPHIYLACIHYLHSLIYETWNFFDIFYNIWRMWFDLNVLIWMMLFSDKEYIDVAYTHTNEQDNHRLRVYFSIQIKWKNENQISHWIVNHSNPFCICTDHKSHIHQLMDEFNVSQLKIFFFFRQRLQIFTCDSYSYSYS